MYTVLITGASGLVGSRLSDLLLQKGYIVTHLNRKTSSVDTRIKVYNWNIEKRTIDVAAITQADYIIHLAGAGIAEKRWSDKRKKEIVESRTQSTQLLFDAIKKSSHKLRGFISASAVGYYGAVTTEAVFEETDLPGNDFLATTCVAWEKSADFFTQLGIRTVKIRTGLVLSDKGGALLPMTKPIRCFLGSALGSGKQYMPWIHIDDLCNMYISAIENDQLQGPYNAVAPQHITNAAFIKTLANVLHKPLYMPNVPAFILKIIMGEMACIVLEGSRISSQKIRNAGVVFKYPTLPAALTQLFKSHL